ncbi:hypothetical protein D3C87_1540560 [compost metagenome]
MLIAGFFNQIAPPQVAALFPLDVAAGAFKDDDVGDGFDVRVFQRFVDVFFQRDAATGTHAFVSGDHQF